MTVFQALVLGILQGLAEFLPISSSAHLALVPWFFGWPEAGLGFDVSLHVGTLVAVLVYFREEWVRLIAAAFSIVRKRKVETETERRVVFLIIATIPGGIGGLLLADYAETTFRSPVLIASALMALGVLLWIVDRYAPRRKGPGATRWWDALLIGAAQVLALLTGDTPPGATITAGRADAFDRESAAVFSFLMSMPIILAAAVLEVPHALAENGLSLPLVVGVLASAVSGWLAIAVLLRFVTRNSYGIFAIYRVVLGLVVLAVIFARG
jgi:undecaprenyl-diphosphatase